MSNEQARKINTQLVALKQLIYQAQVDTRELTHRATRSGVDESLSRAYNNVDLAQMLLARKHDLA